MSFSQRQNKDIQGRAVTYFQGRQICNNFNAGKCRRAVCSYTHVCSKCNDKGHAACDDKCSAAPAPTVKVQTNVVEQAPINTGAKAGTKHTNVVSKN